MILASPKLEARALHVSKRLFIELVYVNVRP